MDKSSKIRALGRILTNHDSKSRAHQSLLKALANDRKALVDLLKKDYSADNPKIAAVFVEPRIPYLDIPSFYEPDFVVIYSDKIKWHCLVLEAKSKRFVVAHLSNRIEMLKREEESMKRFLSTQKVPSQVVDNLEIMVGGVYLSRNNSIQTSQNIHRYISV